MKKILVYIAVFAMIMTLLASPVSALEEPCPECGCLECCCPDFPCYGDPCTPGYWKNHADLWAGMTDLPLGYDSEEWLAILNTPSDGGPWYQLAKHFIASWLNLNAGDVEYVPGHGEDVYDAIDNAESLLEAANGDRSSIDRHYALDLKNFLDIFNNYDRVE
jgi:hypothetical protein